jgi:hypothetical protein
MEYNLLNDLPLFEDIVTTPENKYRITNMLMKKHPRSEYL